MYSLHKGNLDIDFLLKLISSSLMPECKLHPPVFTFFFINSLKAETIDIFLML